jgi:Ni/Co efflux regulator RcnB
MKTSTSQARNLRPIISKIVMAVAVASVMGSMAITPALGQNDGGRSRAAQDHGRNAGNQHDNRNRNANRNDRRDRRESRPVYERGYNYYSEPVYAPPPVYYDRQPSPGISLFFPLNFR